MIADVWSYSYKRTFKEAIIFYIAHFVIVVMAAGLLAGIIGLVAGRSGDFRFGVRVGSIITIMASLTISFTIAYKKRRLGSFWCVVLILMSGLLAYIGAGLLGLIPAAYLSSLKGKGEVINHSTSNPI